LLHGAAPPKRRTALSLLHAITPVAWEHGVTPTLVTAKTEPSVRRKKKIKKRANNSTVQTGTVRIVFNSKKFKLAGFEPCLTAHSSIGTVQITQFLEFL
jgi:hypothetical protein